MVVVAGTLLCINLLHIRKQPFVSYFPLTYFIALRPKRTLRKIRLKGAPFHAELCSIYRLFHIDKNLIIVNLVKHL